MRENNYFSSVKMNSNVTARKYILQTRNQGSNKYWDTSFQLRPPFRANSAGQYKITVNEAKNNTKITI